MTRPSVLDSPHKETDFKCPFCGAAVCIVPAHRFPTGFGKMLVCVNQPDCFKASAFGHTEEEAIAQWKAWYPATASEPE